MKLSELITYILYQGKKSDEKYENAMDQLDQYGHVDFENDHNVINGREVALLFQGTPGCAENVELYIDDTLVKLDDHITCIIDNYLEEAARELDYDIQSAKEIQDTRSMLYDAER